MFVFRESAGIIYMEAQEQHMKVSQVFSGDYLTAADLQGKEPSVVIASVEVKKFDDGDKLLISFQGKKKALVANKTNSRRIAMMYGDETDAWVGKEVVLYTDMVDFQGKTVEALRVRPPKKQAAPDDRQDDF
jgi:hypothetical protein